MNLTRWQLVMFLPVMVVAMLLALVCYLVLVCVSPVHATRVLVGVDQLVNAGFKGSEDETISSRAGKGAGRGAFGWCLLCRVLAFIDPAHCENAIEADEGKTVSRL